MSQTKTHKRVVELPFSLDDLDSSIKANVGKGGSMTCRRCGSTTAIVKDGTRQMRTALMQRYRCTDCATFFSREIEA